MIISCNSCNKKFSIDPSLIPDEGRELQCGSCDHIWFFKIEEEKSIPLTLSKDLENKGVELKLSKNDEKKVEDKKIVAAKKPEKKEKKNIYITKSQETNLEKENKSTKFLSFLVVFIISSIALIILLDTLKKPLINVFPDIEIILFTLFETLKDIKLFIKDLY
ncbi:zinc-ribbon domain-containing protein [Candidatus Pelagibacter bacterium nBUS_28]|uniref:zinc-ribbon domain-containing protein n=1 Tax=Candidatus Pelagibacter bacterium nBUS_28 TaxID=3374189 RepID=UPI003EBC36A8